MKWQIRYGETIHYLAQEVEAKDKNEAAEIFRNRMELGLVPVVDSDSAYFEIEENK